MRGGALREIAKENGFSVKVNESCAAPTKHVVGRGMKSCGTSQRLFDGSKIFTSTVSPERAQITRIVPRSLWSELGVLVTKVAVTASGEISGPYCDVPPGGREIGDRRPERAHQRLSASASLCRSTSWR